MLLNERSPSNWTSQGPWKGPELWHLKGGETERRQWRETGWYLLVSVMSVHVPCWSMSRMRASASQQFSLITRNSFPSIIMSASPWNTTWVEVTSPVSMCLCLRTFWRWICGDFITPHDGSRQLKSDPNVFLMVFSHADTNTTWTHVSHVNGCD